MHASIAIVPLSSTKECGSCTVSIWVKGVVENGEEPKASCMQCILLSLWVVFAIMCAILTG